MIRRSIAVVTAALIATGATAFAGTKSEQGKDVQMVVTVVDRMYHRPAFLKGGLTITDERITSVTPLTGRDLDLFIVIDDAANYDFSTRLLELRQFVTAQPAAVTIGVAYIHNGVLQVVENPTTDHQRAAAALRAPAGSEAANPYCALSDLIQHWVSDSVSREIVLVSAGNEKPEGDLCVNAEAAIEDAQRAGVIVYAVYNPQTFSRSDAAVVDLSEMAYETGGEAYRMGRGPAAPIQPFLADISEHLANQYVVKSRPTSNAGSGLQQVYVVAGTSDQELMAPEKVWLADLTGLNRQ